MSTTDIRFNGMKIALDCANGSASATAKKLFSAMGAECFMLSDTPDGTNINLSCGSTHMENLIDFVKKNKLDAGLAFDGDADRCLAVDENGAFVDGDQLIAISAMDMMERGVLKQDTAVVTVMSNLGFFHFARDNGLKTATTKVGDRYVLEEMIKCGYSIGGEQSGHIIYLDHANTGDGQLSAVILLSVMKRTGKKLSELASVMQTFPQTLVNIKVVNELKSKWETDGEVAASIKSAEDILGENGRVLVRASGTEPLIRVMIEGKDQNEIEALAETIAAEIRKKCC